MFILKYLLYYYPIFISTAAINLFDYKNITVFILETHLAFLCFIVSLDLICFFLKRIIQSTNKLFDYFLIICFLIIVFVSLEFLKTVLVPISFYLSISLILFKVFKLISDIKNKINLTIFFEFILNFLIGFLILAFVSRYYKLSIILPVLLSISISAIVTNYYQFEKYSKFATIGQRRITSVLLMLPIFCIVFLGLKGDYPPTFFLFIFVLFPISKQRDKLQLKNKEIVDISRYSINLFLYSLFFIANLFSLRYIYTLLPVS